MAISRADLLKLAKARLADARALLARSRYDGATYLAGYVVEMALKARICQTLGWTGFPATTSEFKGFQSFKTHDLDVLLKLSGREAHIKTKFLLEWNTVASWDPEARYDPTRNVLEQDARDMIASSDVLRRRL